MNVSSSAGFVDLENDTGFVQKREVERRILVNGCFFVKFLCRFEDF